MIELADVPDELLAKIFVFYKSACDSTNTYSSMTRLCSVSQHWREVVTLDTQFWLEITLNLDKGYPPEPLLKLWLERSDNKPIDVSIDFPGSNRSSDPPSADWDRPARFRELFATLSSSIGRWKSLCIDYSGSTHEVLSRDFFSKLPFNTERKLVEASVGACIYSPELNPIFRALRQAPAIRTFTARGLCNADARVLDHLRWGRLVHLDFSAMLDWDVIVPFLPGCRNLVVLDLDSHFPIENEASMPLYIDLPQLAKLTICGGYYVFKVVARFKCPNLRILAINVRNELDDGQSYAEHLAQFHQFLDRKETGPIRILTIDAPYIPPHVLYDFFSRKRVSQLCLFRVFVLDEDDNFDDYVIDCIKEALRRSRNPNLDILDVRRGNGMVCVSWCRMERLGEAFVCSSRYVDLEAMFAESFDLDAMAWTSRFCLNELLPAPLPLS